MTRRGWLLFAAMAVIWGIPYLLIKIAVGELTPVTLVFLRTALGAALLLPIAAARGGLRPLLPYWRWVLAYTVVEVSLPWFLLSDAERGLSSSLTGLLIAAVPLIGAVVLVYRQLQAARLWPKPEYPPPSSLSLDGTASATSLLPTMVIARALAPAMLTV